MRALELLAVSTTQPPCQPPIECAPTISSFTKGNAMRTTALMVHSEENTLQMIVQVVKWRLLVASSVIRLLENASHAALSTRWILVTSASSATRILCSAATSGKVQVQAAAPFAQILKPPTALLQPPRLLVMEAMCSMRSGSARLSSQTATPTTIKPLCAFFVLVLFFRLEVHVWLLALPLLFHTFLAPS
jgi:hypothetical protein